MMWKIAKKYNTKCYNSKTNELIQDEVFEAIDKNEASTRALLNCLKKNSHLGRDVDIKVSKV